jgi:phage shock protein E
MFQFLTNLFKSPFDSVDVETYERDYYQQQNHVLIDVRTAGEFKSGHIPGARNIPLNQLSDKLDKIPTNKPVIVVCRSGNRSGSACHTLTKAGYDNVINLRGGTMRWQMAGNAVE